MRNDIMKFAFCKRVFGIFILTAALFAGCAGEQEPESEAGDRIVAQPVRYAFNMPGADEMPHEHLGGLRDEHKPGCYVTYLVESENLIGFVGDSIAVKSIVSENGKDISKNKTGDPAWWISKDIKVSSNGKSALFSIFVATEKPMTLPIINGTVIMKTAGAVKTETLTFSSVERGMDQRAGPLKISVNPELKHVHVYVNGDTHLIREIRNKSDGKILICVGTSFTTGTKTYIFDKEPTTPEIDLEVTYYADIVNMTVDIVK
ncbi:MAG: hypothetical protein FWG05_03485 [Kiritimatiellaeota bacterium]|nr:hypothetical protein [Kiritimatiellota bacterium]